MLSKYTKAISGVQTRQIKPFNEVRVAYSMIRHMGLEMIKDMIIRFSTVLLCNK